jgi:hypothetical protein
LARIRLPLGSVDEFRQHGQVRGVTLHQSLAESEAAIESMQGLGSISTPAERLQDDGVAAFGAALDRLLATLDRKRGARVNS